MKMNTPALIILIVGLILLYGAVKNKSPLDVAKGAVKGQSPTTAGPLKK